MRLHWLTRNSRRLDRFKKILDRMEYFPEWEADLKAVLTSACCCLYEMRVLAAACLTSISERTVLTA